MPQWPRVYCFLLVTGFQYTLYILKFLDYCQSGPVFVIIENAWAFYKMRKKKVLFLFLETVAVSFKWWVYEICRHGNCKVGVLGPFFLPWVLNFYFENKCIETCIWGLKGDCYTVQKKYVEKKCLILLLLCRKQIPFLTCAYFSLPPLEWIYRSVHMMQALAVFLPELVIF